MFIYVRSPVQVPSAFSHSCSELIVSKQATFCLLDMSACLCMVPDVYSTTWVCNNRSFAIPIQ